MAWTASTFAKHNKWLNGDQTAHAARIANAILKEGKDEATAIRIANEQMAKAGKVNARGRYKSYRAK